MELNSEHTINAPREAVFAALNDPEILRQCIPGCESLDKESDTEMSAMVTLKIGPVKARFKGRVEISNLVPPESYSISGQGSGGASGFAKGGADITLIEIGDATLLQYEVKAEVGGRLAQLGGRLIESTATVLLRKFFERFCELVEGEKAADLDTGDAAQDTVVTSHEDKTEGRTWIWIGAGVAALIAVLAIIFSTSG